MSLHPKVIDLTLDRMHRLLDRLGNPERDLPPVIHIAGTNGKGSTLAMIRAGLIAAGHSCHAYTSPHLARFHERIRLGGDLIEENALMAVLEECEAANGDTPITYFEITTCAALLAFARSPADYTLLEVGLGGRLDATNVIEAPALTVITPVSIDHQQFLGDTLDAIAGEKAGILKRNTFCVVGPQEDDAQAVIESQAARVGATLKSHGQDWHVWEEDGRTCVQDENGLWDLPLPALLGAHQVSNAGTAAMALRLLGLGENAAAAGLNDAIWPARMQRLTRGPLVDAAPNDLWLDGGHNPAAGAALAETLSRIPARPLHLVCGMLNTKDVAGYLTPLARIADHLHGVSIPGEAATLSAQDTVAAAQGIGLSASAAESTDAAINRIRKTAPNARILICGSLYLAGQVLRDNG
ncbi:MAG: folylpolyglutamate synthase/dihydrofolate synthase family protein [Pseudomonadota bacterium]